MNAKPSINENTPIRSGHALKRLERQFFAADEFQAAGERVDLEELATYERDDVDWAIDEDEARFESFCRSVSASW
jgi:hypothetical protein